MARNVYGLDLGTYEIKVFDKRKNEIWCEKNVIAMKDRKYIFSLGDQAYEMYEKSPDNIQVVFPMKNGVIAHFDDMQYLLGNLLKTGRQFVRGSEYVIAVPTDVTAVSYTHLDVYKRQPWRWPFRQICARETNFFLRRGNHMIHWRKLSASVRPTALLPSMELPTDR